MSRIEMNEPCPFEKIAKVATRNRQKLEFRQIVKMKLVQHQILCGKLVSQRSFESRSPKLDYLKMWRF